MVGKNSTRISMSSRCW